MPFKDHFSGHADAYREARPTYPDALFDWLAAQAPQRELVWDAGCGNGQASCALAQYFERVVATDPSARQIAQAVPHPRVEYRVEPAEHSSLADASVDLVGVAQALHWFDFAAFFAEVHRVLKPNGVFAAWSYADCHVDPAVDVAIGRAYADLTGPYWPPERAHVDDGYARIDIPFEPVVAPPFEMVAHWNAAQLLAYLRSWSATQRYLKANGRDPIAEVEDELLRAWGDPTQVRDVRWVFHLRVARKEQ
jgi:SAM-dependent methyltransferase